MLSKSVDGENGGKSSFFVELNELPRVQNTRIKGGQQDRFVSHEGYYTLYDSKKESLSKDRLALKLFLIHNGKFTFIR